MQVDELKHLTPRERFLYWVKERHQVYLRRKAGLPPPWSRCPLMQTTFFTNVYRELDKTTVWFRENVRQPLMEDPRVLFATIAFRWFNLPSTGEILLGETGQRNLLVEWDLAEAMDRLRAWRNDPSNLEQKLFTGAFCITPNQSSKEKMVRVCEDYIDPAWRQCGPGGSLLQALEATRRLGGCTLAHTHALISKLPCMGGKSRSEGFMAAQVVADLKYTALAGHAQDWWTWCNLGPGSMEGMNRLYEFPIDFWMPQSLFLEKVNGLREWLTEQLPRYPRLHSQDVQNCLCEFSKFERALEGQRPKRRYRANS